MKVTITGTVVSRSYRSTPKGEIYSVVIEEPGQFPSRFQLSTRLASMLGSKDGPFGVGKTVTASAFVNGREEDAKRRDGSSFKAYRVWFNLAEITSASAEAVASAPAPAADGVADDIPF